MKKILLQGYYGFGNLGDDILLLVCFRNFKQHFPDAELVVFSNAGRKTSAYLIELLGAPVRIINYAVREHFDVIIHGGGGVHYDYEPGNFFYCILNRLILLRPSWFGKLFNLYKKIKNKEHITGTCRVGIGIGIGTFTQSSKKLYSNLDVLSGYNYLLVRDSASLTAAKQFSLPAPPVLSTDLAFYTDYWQPMLAIRNGNATDKKIGIVLRHWKYGNTYVDDVVRIASGLSVSGFTITFFLFEAIYDSPCMQKLPNNFNLVKWGDGHVNIGSFMAHLSAQSLIVSARFHGVILAATLGIPSVAIKLDPKLATLAEMLPQSACLIGTDDISKHLEPMILNIYRNLPAWQQQVRHDYERNYKLIVEGIAAVNKFIANRNENS